MFFTFKDYIDKFLAFFENLPLWFQFRTNSSKKNMVPHSVLEMSVSSIADDVIRTREFSWLFLKQKVTSHGIPNALPTELLGKLYQVGKILRFLL